MASKVGVRELRQNLSKYLTRVKAGEELVVTERGHEVARLIPTASEGYLELARKYGATIPRSDLVETARRLPRRRFPEGTTDAYLAETRRDKLE
ncbi:MAG: type II toxin-antitoxin system Phd/YefM family antitoxin [Polyangiaceae bacterium]